LFVANFGYLNFSSLYLLLKNLGCYIVTVGAGDIGDGAVVGLLVRGRERGEHELVRGHDGRQRDTSARHGPSRGEAAALSGGGGLLRA
jgi:hypothetical protein